MSRSNRALPLLLCALALALACGPLNPDDAYPPGGHEDCQGESEPSECRGDGGGDDDGGHGGGSSDGGGDVDGGQDGGGDADGGDEGGQDGGSSDGGSSDGGSSDGGSSDGGSSDGGSGGPAAACDANDLREVCQVFRLVNAARAEAGVAPMAWDARLALAAQRHADDMVANDYFSHTSLDGRSFVDRVRAENYAGSATGENIASGHQTPAAVMQDWMGSTGHRNNILSDRSNEVGVGLKGRIWVQVFGRK